ncbi:hypothetical protein [Mesomycoplasma lagogenitalium]|uniref:DUF3137 domain-containing protein n=1 Tax=Mesomycoplasma lagogenitalium TaxID=171286 RepID=A0ABY8LWI7_9BACT|nr:hypothetical protein [Mesomycoplasma lagogenitalium]WGI36611.1 hypothetical protein QEG99_04065 [Mesomycoplasma lagogenitalium]
MTKDKKIKQISKNFQEIYITNLDENSTFFEDNFDKFPFLETKRAKFFKKVKLGRRELVIFSLIYTFYWVFTPLFIYNESKELKITWIILSSVFSFLYLVFFILLISKKIFVFSSKRVVNLKVNLVMLNNYLSLIEDKNINIKRFNIVSKTEIIEKYFDDSQLKSDFYLEIKTTSDQSIFWNCYDKNNSNWMFYFEDNKKIITYYLKEEIDIFNYKITSHFLNIYYLLVENFIEKLKILTKEIN